MELLYGSRTIPWRLVEDTAKLRSCYIGIGFYKSSHFRESERKGFLRALDEKGIRSKDLVAITDTDVRLFGDKEYPPKRGTLLAISETEGVLYTRGTVDFYKTYPGMYVPNPLKEGTIFLSPHRGGPRSARVANEHHRHHGRHARNCRDAEASPQGVTS